MATTWPDGAPRVMRLPSGRLVRGRGLRHPMPDGLLLDGREPEFGVYLLGARPEPMPWPSRWVRWPDFRLPADRPAFIAALHEVLARCGSERVEIACGGGNGRTGTALACLAVLDGVDPRDAVAYVREHYSPKAVETPWQKRFVRRFDAGR